MSEPTGEPTATTETVTTTPPTADTTDWKAEAERLKTEAAKWQNHSRKQEERAKANADAAKRLAELEPELETLRTANQTEHEKALTKAAREAEAKGRTTALAEVGLRLVKAEFKAAAGGKVPDLDALLDDLNLGKFLKPDGEPDTDAIANAVKRFVREPETKTETVTEPAQQTVPAPGPRPDLTQGSRQSMPLNGDPILDAVKTKLGIR